MAAVRTAERLFCCWFWHRRQHGLLEGEALVGATWGKPRFFRLLRAIVALASAVFFWFTLFSVASGADAGTIACSGFWWDVPEAVANVTHFASL